MNDLRWKLCVAPMMDCSEKQISSDGWKTARARCVHRAIENFRTRDDASFASASFGSAHRFDQDSGDRV